MVLKLNFKETFMDLRKFFSVKIENYSFLFDSNLSTYKSYKLQTQQNFDNNTPLKNLFKFLLNF